MTSVTIWGDTVYWKPKKNMIGSLLSGLCVKVKQIAYKETNDEQLCGKLFAVIHFLLNLIKILF
jgi:hypothetical protein